jgi:hypothetical protein
MEVSTVLDRSKIDLVSNGVQLVNELEMESRFDVMTEICENSVPLHPRVAVDVIHHFRPEDYREELHARSDEAGSYYALYDEEEMILILRENVFPGRQFVLIGYYWLGEEEQEVLDRLLDEYGSDAFPVLTTPFAKIDDKEGKSLDHDMGIVTNQRPPMEHVSFKALNRRAPEVPIVERPRRRIVAN